MQGGYSQAEAGPWTPASRAWAFLPDAWPGATLAAGTVQAAGSFPRWARTTRLPSHALRAGCFQAPDP